MSNSMSSTARKSPDRTYVSRTRITGRCRVFLF